MQKILKNDWNPGIRGLISEYSARAIQWIPTWQGWDGSQKSLRFLVLWTKVALALEGLISGWRQQICEGDCTSVKSVIW